MSTVLNVLLFLAACIAFWLMQFVAAAIWRWYERRLIEETERDRAMMREYDER